MNNTQHTGFDMDEIEQRAQKFLSDIENPDIRKNLDADEIEIIQRIAELSEVDDFDSKSHYAVLLRKIQNLESPRRIRINRTSFLKVISRVAAVVLLGVISLVVVNYMKNISDKKNNLANAEMVNLEDKNVKLTLSNGSVVDLTEKAKTSVSIKDSVFKQNLEVNPQTALKYNTLEVPKTKTFSLQLADGTMVKINSDSKIKFPEKFSDSERRVVLEEGEAYFNVTKDSKKPFIVEVRDSRIKVMGTSFNVNAYPESNLKTTLVEGKVKMSTSTSTHEVTLKPGQQAELSQGYFDIQNVDVNPYIAWTKGLFMFDDLDLKSIMRQLNRWYNIDATFADPAIEKYSFTGVINKTQSKDYIFSILEKTTHIKIEVKNSTNVYISQK